jgi:hypothetical protein
VRLLVLRYIVLCLLSLQASNTTFVFPKVKPICVPFLVCGLRLVHVIESEILLGSLPAEEVSIFVLDL